MKWNVFILPLFGANIRNLFKPHLQIRGCRKFTNLLCKINMGLTHFFLCAFIVQICFVCLFFVVDMLQQLTSFVCSFHQCAVNLYAGLSFYNKKTAQPNNSFLNHKYSLINKKKSLPFALWHFVYRIKLLSYECVQIVWVYDLMMKFDGYEFLTQPKLSKYDWISFLISVRIRTKGEISMLLKWLDA